MKDSIFLRQFFILLCIFCNSFFVSAHVIQNTTIDFDALLKDLQKANQKSTVDAVTIASWLMSQKEDGSWVDIMYGTLPHDPKVTNKHIERILELVKVCSNTESAAFNSEAYKKAIQKGLDYWFISNTKHWNWWFHKIDYPKKIGIIIALMRQIPDNGLDEKKLMTLFIPTEINDITSSGGGANMLDIATHYLYRGILTKDENLIQQTIAKVSDSLLTNITKDLCYLDHGPQLYIHGYGTEMIRAVLQLAYLFKNIKSRFNTRSGNFVLFLQFIRETWLPSIRGQYWDFSIMGRGIVRKNNLKANVNSILKMLVNIDPNNARVYEQAIARIEGNALSGEGVIEKNKHYWAADYMQHQRKYFFFSTRAISKRTVEAEAGNGDNLKSHYFSLGANCIMTTGDEYYNIMPVWNWTMIPGTTYKQTDTFLSTRKQWGVNYGKTNFVGGVSDDMYGAFAYDFEHGTNRAKKAWFMFDKEVVALGADITDNSNLPTYTTINQCLSTPDDAVFYKIKNDKKEIKKTFNTTDTSSSLDYIRHKNIAYFFLQPNQVRYTHFNQSGRLSQIANVSNTEPTDSVTLPVFSLFFDHQIAPVRQSYAYAIVPNIETENAAKKYSIDAIKIIANTDVQQIVYHDELKMYQAVFYKAEKFTHQDKTVQVNKPCVLMLKNGKVLSIADPPHLLQTVDVTILSNGQGTTKTIPFSEIKGKTTSVLF